MDTMDSLPSYLDKETYEPLMGSPFYKMPAPDGKSANYAVQYAQDFIDVFTELGATPKIVWSHELYESGKMNEVIKTALDNADKIRTIYLKVAKQEKPVDWHPFQVTCPQCGKLGSTIVDKWDGEKVHFRCEPALVTWAEGCGYEGEISPFNGTGKLMWKADWPAHWRAIGVTIEGAGKDHSSDGGSRDIAKEIIKDVFNYTNPYDIPYEWFLIGGHKMSSSKGVGTSARDFADMMPPFLGRFLFVRTKYSRQMNFDPTGDTIPDLFDEYDRMAEEYWSGAKSDYARIFELSQIGAIPKRHILPRFRDIARMIQDPKINLIKELESQKGSQLTNLDQHILEERIRYAKIWLENYAPKEDVFKVSQDIVAELTDLQKKYLKTIVVLLDKEGREPESFQQELYQTTKTLGIPPKDAFAAIYQVMINKTHGPKAAWLLLENKDIAKEKINSIDSKSTKAQTVEIKSTRTDAIKFDTQFENKYPSASVGFAHIQGLSIKTSDPKLEAERQSLLSELEGLTTEQINTFPEILSYRKMYKEMGVDWHSRRPSPEALLRRIATGKGLYPAVNTCVDAYNLAVMKYRVSSGAFDASKLKLPVSIKIAAGGEKEFFLGDKTEPTVLKPGEVSYVDQIGPYNMDYNYRDAIRTSVTLDTKDIWINVDGVYDITPEKVMEVLEENIRLIQKYCGGVVVEKGIIKGAE
jgi:lysyl-tRNA synthetase class 1